MNPIRQHRLELGLSQAKLAHAANISTNSLLRQEQGCPAFPSSQLATIFNMTYAELEAEYKAFQTATRISTGKSLTEAYGGRLTLASLDSFDRPVGSFQDFRLYVLDYTSQIGFCKAFCLHQATVNAYERQMIRRMPYQVVRALGEADVMQPGLIKWLDELGRLNFDRATETEELNELGLVSA